MPLDPSIPLSGRMPVIDSPAKTIGDMMRNRALGAEIAQREAETEQAKVQTAVLQEQASQRQREVESARHLQTILQDPTVHESIGRGDFTAIWNSGVSPTLANPIIKGIQDMREKALSLDEKQASHFANGRALLAKTIQGLDPDDAAAAQQWNSSLPILAQQYPELAKQLTPLSSGPNFRDSLKQIAGSNSIAYQMLVDSAARAKEAAALAEQEQKTAQQAVVHDFTVAEKQAELEAAEREQLARENPTDAAAQAAALDAKERLAAAQQQRTADEQKRHNQEIERHQRVVESRPASSELTTDQKNFQQAKREGFTGDFLAWMRERNPRATTGKERTDLGFFNRAKEAHETVTTSGLEDRVAKSGLVEQGRLMLPNILQGKDQQSYRQAQRAFTEARLRKESGAAIPQGEYDNDARTYWGVAGDDPATIDQKRKARGTVLEGLKFAAGRAYEEFYGEPNKPAGRAPSGIPTVDTKAEYDALPKGTQYIDKQDGKTYTKR